MNTKCVLLMLALIVALCGAGYGAEPNVPVIEPDPVQGITVWGLSEADADSTLEARIGYELKSRFEPFVGLKYLTGSPEWGPAPDIVSGGLIYHVNEFGLIADPSPDNPFEEILHALKARPYGGIEVAVPTQGDQRKAKLNVIAGTLFSNEPTCKTAFVVEYVSGNGLGGEDNQSWRMGGRFRF